MAFSSVMAEPLCALATRVAEVTAATGVVVVSFFVFLIFLLGLVV